MRASFILIVPGKELSKYTPLKTCISMKPRHVLLVSFPVQGNINPALQFAQTLINTGIAVTFATTAYARRSMITSASYEAKKGLTFVTFSDGTEDGYKLNNDGNLYMSELRNGGIKTMKDVIRNSSKQGRPVMYVVYTLLLPWAAEVAREANIPSALLWAQPAVAFDVYYYYFNGFKDEIHEKFSDPTWEVQFPGIPLKFSQRELPSLVLPTSSPSLCFVLTAVKKKLETLDSEVKPIVLVNTFDALEPDALKSIEKYELIGIGPLINSPALLDGEESCGDLFQWLNSKTESSVVYVAFGSMVKLPRSQMEEIAKGLLDARRPFLWVIRVNEEYNGQDEKLISCMEELGNLGKIVPWCSQLDVLTHTSLGCFVTHCGWNSTLESLWCGVPMVAFPQYADQGTNAKLIEDVWRVGVRVKVNENGVVEGDEIRACIEKVVDGGENGRELRENAKKWKGLAKEAMGEDGSSNKNLKAFLQEIGDGF